jgi:hypothetical protein
MDLYQGDCLKNYCVEQTQNLSAYSKLESQNLSNYAHRNSAANERYQKLELASQSAFCDYNESSLAVIKPLN